MRLGPSCLVVVLLALAASGCSRDDPSARRSVVASFYPLAWAAEQVEVGSEHVVDLTPPGVEPHDLELSPRDASTIRNARLVVYVGGGFQPAVEDAVATGAGGPVLDVLGTESDPHLWLDPIRFARVVREIARALGRPEAARPAVRSLERLDGAYRRGLADCDRRVVVTTHASFGALAARYGLTAVSLAGRAPESEPTPRRLEREVDELRRSGATTVFSEPLVSHRVADTVAREAGVRVATLDPLEGLTEDRVNAGEDYLTVMRANLRALREALGCR